MKCKTHDKELHNHDKLELIKCYEDYMNKEEEYFYKVSARGITFRNGQKNFRWFYQ